MTKMKPLKISIVDDNANVAETVGGCIRQPNKILGDLEIECSIHTNFKDDLITAQTILKKKPDMVILDYDLGCRDNTGLKIASEIKKTNSYLPIILMSGVPLHLRQKVMMSGMNNKIADGFFGKPFDINEVRKIVRKNIRRPLNVGIVGVRGEMGLGFLETLSRNLNIRNIKACSESLRGDYSKIKDLEFVDEEKVSFGNRLEDVLEDTNCVLICTSALHGKGKLAKNPDRSDLFPHECEKINDISKRIKEFGYEGLAAIFTNPVGQNLEVFRRAGLNPYQLTSPLSLDSGRINNLIRRQAIIENIQTPEKGICVVGEHGVPDVSIPPETPANYQRVIQKAVEEVRTLPEKSMKAHIKNGISYHEAQNTYTSFLRDLAHFRTRTNHSAYCYCEFGGKKGYIAVPHKVKFYKRIRVIPDKKRIGQLNENLKNEKFVEILNKQNKQVQQYLRGLN